MTAISLDQRIAEIEPRVKLVRKLETGSLGQNLKSGWRIMVASSAGEIPLDHWKAIGRLLSEADNEDMTILQKRPAQKPKSENRGLLRFLPRSIGSRVYS